MSPSRRLLLALAALSPSAFALGQQSAPASSAAAAAEPPEKVARFEQMLVRSPGPGRAFDEVFGHWFATQGPAALEARWRAARDAARPGSPEAAAYGLLLGQLAERIGDYTTARARYAEVAAAAPADFRAHHRLGRLEIREGRLPAGIAALEKAAALNLSPADAQDVLRDLARARTRAMDDIGALAAWKNLAERFPDDALVLEEVGEAQLEAAAYDEATATFTALEKLAAGDAYRAVLARLRLGEVAAKKGDRDAALARFSAALDNTHRDSWLHREAYARIDALFRQRGDFDGLVAFHTARLSGTSRDSAAARRLADLLIELQRNDDAIAWLDKACGWSPDDHSLRFAHIKALIAADRGADALPLLQTLVKRHPKESAYREALGNLHWQRAQNLAGDPAAASSEKAAALSTWEALAPAGAPASDLLALADLYRSRGLDEEARAVLARALATEPNAYDLRERLALQLLAMKRDDEAWSVARNTPAGLADAGQYRRLALLERRQNLPAEALASVDRGLALAKDNYDLLELRWQLLAELKRWDDALALYPQLLAHAPNEFALETVESRHLQALRSAEKDESTLKTLADRVAAEDASLTESDFRLYLRLLSDRETPLNVEPAFAAARKRFPQSFTLALLEADYRDRNDNLENRAAALRRLIALRPDRAPEFLRRLVNAHRNDGDFEGARRAAAELLALAPSDAQNHLLIADLEFDAGNTADGNASLQRALRLAPDPAPVRARLARAYLDQNRAPAALAIYEDAFYAAPDDNARRALIQPLVESAISAGDFDGVVTRYTERNRPRRDTPEYQAELGELHFAAQDFPRAQECWDRSLALNRDNPRLLSRAIELARRNGDSANLLRLAKLRQELSPSPSNAIELADALLENGQAEEAAEIYTANASQFFTDTALLSRIMPQLSGRGVADSLIERLRAEAAGAADASQRDLVLATAFMALGDLARAEPLLWEIYRRPPSAPTAATPSNAAAASSAQPQPPVDWNMAAYRAAQTSANAASTARYMLESNNRNRGYSRSFNRFSSNLPPYTTEAQDTALGYLAAIALQRDQADAFLARLEADFEARKLPASERLLEFAKLQARDAVLRHVDAALAETAPSLPGLNIAQQFLQPPYDPYTGEQLPGEPDLEKKRKAVSELLAKQSASGSASSFQTAVQRISGLDLKKDSAAALAILDELKTSPTLSAMEKSQLLFYRLHILMQAELTEDLDRTLAELVAKEPLFAGEMCLYFFGQYLSQIPADKVQARLETLMPLMVEAISKPVPANSPYGNVRMTNRGRSSQQDLHMLFHYGAAYFGIQPNSSDAIQQLFKRLGDRAPELVDRLLAIAAERDANALRQTRLIALRHAFAAKDVKRAEAIGEALLKDQPEPGLLFNLAELARREDRLDVAKARYEAIPTSAGNISIAAQARLLELAMSADDKDAAKAAATRLVKLRAPNDLPNGTDIKQTLEQLGLKDLLAAPAVAVSPSRNSNDRYRQLNQLNNDLSRSLNKKETASAQEIARRMFASTSLADTRGGNDWPRRQALAAYVRTGLIDDYLADLDAKYVRNPASVTTLELLAEAHAALREQQYDYSRNLPTLATSTAPLALPVRLRLARRGDTLVASYAPLDVGAALRREDAPEGAPVAGGASDPTPPATPAWTEFATVSFPALGNPQPAFAARQQNHRDLSASGFSDIRVEGAPGETGDFKAKTTAQLAQTTLSLHAFKNTLPDGASVEFTLDAPADAKTRLPAARGLALRDADNTLRAVLLLDDKGVLTFSARRYPFGRHIDYLAALVAVRPRDENLRQRYVQALLANNRGEDAIAFLQRPENADLLPRFASQDALIKAQRKAGTLEAFALSVAERAASKRGRSNQDTNGAQQLAQRLADLGDHATAVLVWEKILPAAQPYEVGNIRGLLVASLMALDTPASRTRATEVVRDTFIPPPSPDEKAAPLFPQLRSYGYAQPWYANQNYSNRSPVSNELNSLDAVSDPAILDALLRENAPRLTAPDVGWEPRCYDLALRMRAGDPSAPAAFATLWKSAVDAATEARSGKPRRGRPQQSPLEGFLPACLDRLATWPDPDRHIEGVYRDLIARLPADQAAAQNSPFANLGYNPWMQHNLRLTWADLLRARGDDAGARQALRELCDQLNRDDLNQTNPGTAIEVVERLLSFGDLQEAQRVHDKVARRIVLGRNYAKNKRYLRLVATLDALAGKGAPLPPALAAWIAPVDGNGAELRWHITGRLPDDKDIKFPRPFTLPLPSIPDGAYDLLVEFAASEKGEALARFELPAVAARGRHRLTETPPDGACFLRASLRPRAGGDLITLPPQVFSARPNLLANPNARVEKAGDRLAIPGWNLASHPFQYPGGPLPDARVTHLFGNERNDSNQRSGAAAIPVDPTKFYLVSGWALQPVENSSAFQIEFLGENGKRLNDGNWQSFDTEDPRWQRFTMIVGPNSKHSLPNRSSLPAKAAALRLRISGPEIEYSDLNIQELPLPPAPETPANPAQTASPKPARQQTTTVVAP